jgi:hypothetical protein
MRAGELFLTINDYLTTVVKVDDAIFGFRVGNLFKSMDFDQFPSLLETVTNGIGELETGLRCTPDQWEFEVGEEGFALLLSYLSNLREASSKLRDIAQTLALQAKGQTYRYRQYRTDLAAYDRSVAAYMALGDDMNYLFRSVI